MSITPWQPNPLDSQLIDLAFAEDLGLPYSDVTTMALFPNTNHNIGKASILSKHSEPIVICGLPIVQMIFEKLSDQCDVQSVFQDGEKLASGETLLLVTGPAQALLMAERTLLNFLQHLSAIATLTRRFVNQIEHTKTSILDTRKTLPGLRHLEKYAVYCGGGVNHRMGLYDAIMVKDTHIDLLGGIHHALDKLTSNATKNLPVIVEIRTQQELEVVLQKGLQKVTRVLLDNMSLELMQ